MGINETKNFKAIREVGSEIEDFEQMNIYVLMADLTILLWNAILSKYFNDNLGEFRHAK